MEKKKSKGYLFAVLSSLTVLLVVIPLLPKAPRFSYDYKVGQHWRYETLYAQFDFPILKTDEQISSEKALLSSAVTPFYRFVEEVSVEALSSSDTMNLEGREYMRPAIKSAMEHIYERGLVDKVDGISDVIYIQRNKRALKVPVAEVYTSEAASLKIRELCDTDIVLIPNLVYDSLATTTFNKGISVDVSPTAGYVKTGDVVVNQGEFVTAYIAQILDSYKKEYETTAARNGGGPAYIIGNAVIFFAIILVLICVIYMNSKSPGGNKFRKMLYVIMVFLMCSITVLLVQRYNPDLMLAVPFCLFALFLRAFLTPKTSVMVYLVVLMPVLAYADSAVVCFTISAVSGVLTICIFPFFSKGWKQFINSSFILAAQIVIYLAFRAVGLGDYSAMDAITKLVWASFLPVAGYPLTFLFERMFGFVSANRLNELTDISSPLLHSLEQNAPGTFQHSIVVSNMAVMCAQAIGANVELTKAGALYHDIGKINNPLCFVENESLIQEIELDSYHAGISPVQSATDIIRHVSDGETIAREHRIPSQVIEFITTHHGTSMMSYFLTKYLNENPEGEEKDAFRYKGMKPFTREQVIVMLCDGIEAASRTLKDHSQKVLSDFVDRMVKARLDEGQLSEADITLREMTIVTETIKNYLLQVYHERITYPTRTKKII